MDYSAKITGLQAQIRANEQTMRALPSNNVKKYNALCSKNSKIKVQIEDLERKRDQERDKVRSKDIANDPNRLDPKSRFGRPKDHATGYTNDDYVNQVIDGVEFSNHAIKEMRERGFYSFEILEIVRTTVPKTDKKHSDRWNYYYKTREVFIVTDKGNGRIITIFFNKKILDW